MWTEICAKFRKFNKRHTKYKVDANLFVFMLSLVRKKIYEVLRNSNPHKSLKKKKKI